MLMPTSTTPCFVSRELITTTTTITIIIIFFIRIIIVYYYANKAARINYLRTK